MAQQKITPLVAGRLKVLSGKLKTNKVRIDKQYGTLGYRPLAILSSALLLSACVGGNGNQSSSAQNESSDPSSASSITPLSSVASSEAPSSAQSVSSEAVSSEMPSSQVASSSDQQVSSIQVSSSQVIVSSVSSVSVSSEVDVSSSSEVVVQSSSSEAPSGASNLLTDGTFAQGMANGFSLSQFTPMDATGTTSASIDYADQSAKVSIVSVATNAGASIDYTVQLLHDAALEQGADYTLCFDAKADAPRTILADVDAGMEGVGNINAYASLTDAEAPSVDLTSEYQTFSFSFSAIATDSSARVIFNLSQTDINVEIDNIGLYAGSQCGQPSDQVQSSSVPASSSSMVGSSSSAQGGPKGVGSTIEAESLNTQVSSGYKPEGDIGVGSFGAGGVLCYDDIDLTGVSSIEFMYARNAPDVPTDGRFAILAGGPDPLTATNLGEVFTTDTGGWTTYAPLNVGLEAHNIGSTQLCLFGMEAGGIGNFDSFTLSADMADNDGVTQFDLSVRPTGPVVDPITVVGNEVRFGGEAKSIAGVSMFWSSPAFGSDAYYNKDIVQYLVDEWDIGLIRAAMAVDDNKPNDGKPLDELKGYIDNPFINQHALEEIVHAAIEAGIYVIIDWHAHKAEDHKEEAIAFFTDMAEKYGSYNNVIFEVYNEPVNTSWPVIKSYAEEVIAAIRGTGSDNLIIVGTGFFSQEVNEPAANPIAGENIAYTLHFYAATHGQSLITTAKAALDQANPIALFVTEWGMTEASGAGRLANDMELNLWLDFMREYKLSHANWAISSHDQASAALKRGANTRGSWSPENLTDGGSRVKKLIQEWNQ